MARAIAPAARAAADELQRCVRTAQSRAEWGARMVMRPGLGNGRALWEDDLQSARRNAEQAEACYARLCAMGALHGLLLNLQAVRWVRLGWDAVNGIEALVKAREEAA